MRSCARMSRTSIFALVVVCLIPAATRAQSPPKTLLTPQQRQEAAALVVEFRKVRGQPEKRQDVIERAAKIDLVVVNQLLDIVRKELDPQLADYQQQFRRAAGAVIANRTAVDKLDEIDRIRKEILALAKQ